ncbi:NAD(P)/FAD-dependent oxidoreductase [Vibrio hippocampi]|uniref:Amine oxidase domain-containing protein n=1 Tax=Vibrio hippocampi TaxID=654686 RepID=A0ABM8ZI27_9VIBR|nr:FAD-dependent oxidoreductase [Vibrio hippocampi]CAH0526487.1 hypothetical protein VHP8226_01841 [Vibrio hippocampi]
MKIAIIGTGISGLTCGHYLHKQHDVTLYEANGYIGGHTATVDVEFQGQQYAVDTGFIVYNDRTYPNFIAMMNEIGVKGIATQMSFSVKNSASKLEYNGHTVSTLFAQKRNWLNPKFYRFIFEIIRFNRLAKQYVQQEGMDGEQSLGDFLQQHRFNQFFCDNYILPMGAAIWSSTLADMRAFPIGFFLRFFLNHGLLDIVNRPQWHVIEGGSRSYIEPLTQGFADQIRLNSPVSKVVRQGGKVTIESNGQAEVYDQVIFACHSDQALALIGDVSEQEQDILGKMQYQNNHVVLHHDTQLLPQRKQAWAAWNYALDGSEEEQRRLPTLTYNMNILQHIQAPCTFCVSLNSSDTIQADKILREFNYSHPVFTTESIHAQSRREELWGRNNTWFCGAYWYNGFHEDGVKSALDVVRGIEANVSGNMIDVQGAA